MRIISRYSSKNMNSLAKRGILVLRYRTLLVFFGILGLIIISSYLLMRWAAPPARKPSIRATEASKGNYYTIRDPEGKVILQTGFPINVGDLFINEDNRVFEIFKVEEWNALAKQTSPSIEIKSRPLEGNDITARLSGDQAIPAQAAGIHVVIYHTHSDESYPISDGTSSIPGNGTIFEVGENLAASLRASGISVTHSYNTHGPHDSGAYYRSRRTAFQLLKEGPDAAFDVHRDSAPAEAYYTLINGLPTARTMIVIGRQNPNLNTNLDFARRVKSRADDLYPGLVRGIFIGRGNYNQDLYPTALLLEIGTDQLSRESAQRGAQHMGDVIAEILRG